MSVAGSGSGRPGVRATAAATKIRWMPGDARTAPRRVGRQIGGVTVEQLADRPGDRSVGVVGGELAREPRELEVFVGGVAGGQPRRGGNQKGVDALEQRSWRGRGRHRCGPEVVWLGSGEQPFELSARDRGDLLGAQSSRERCAEHEGGGRDGAAVWGVGGEQDLAGRDQCEQRELIGCVPPGGVEEQVGLAGGRTPDPCQIGDREVREDDRSVRERPGQCNYVPAERWDPSPGVHDDR